MTDYGRLERIATQAETFILVMDGEHINTGAVIRALYTDHRRLVNLAPEQRAAKDAAYLERNKLVALLASIYPSGIRRTAIEGWSEDWHGCVYIDLPWGQASWHYHDSQADLFAHLPPYVGEWDGHTTDAKYEAIVRASRASAQPAPVGVDALAESRNYALALEEELRLRAEKTDQLLLLANSMDADFKAYAKAHPAALRVTGPNSDGEYWLHIKAGGRSGGINLGDQHGSICKQLLDAVSETGAKE